MSESDAKVRAEEVPTIASVMAWSFGMPVADCEPWFRRAGIENIHVHRRGSAIDAALIAISMGQFFGGKSVPMVGIAGVATSAEARGTGAAIALMTRILREKRAEGFAVSTLYPATLGLYRKVGYELAGAHFVAKVPLAAITLRERDLPLRAMTPEDAPAVEACYRAKASRTNGLLDRGPYVWTRVREPRDVTTRGFVVGEAGNVEGYMFVHEKRDPSLFYALHASDFVATTPRAYRRLLTFAADHGTLGTFLQWTTSPADPSVHLIPRVGCEVSLRSTWMLRVLDVAKAMTARGWPAHVRAALDLDIADDVIPENAGRWTLRIADGRAEMARGGSGSVRIDVRALAPLYSSWIDPFAAASAGTLVATDAELATMSAAFAGTSPWMVDFF